MREEDPGIMSAETLEEMITFKYNDKNEPEAEIGMHDDRVISMAIAQYMKTKLYLPANQKGYPHRNHHNYTEPIISLAAWT